MSTDPSDAPAAGRGPILAAGGLLVGALGLALVLTWDAVHLRYGAPAVLCAGGSACGEALGAPAAWFSGAPVPVWLASLHATALVLLPGALGAGARARQARGGLLLLAVATVGISLVLAALAGPGGLPLVGLLVLEVAAVGAVAATPGGRRPAWPLVDDWLPGLLLGLTAVMGLGFGARILDHRLAGVEEAAAEVPALALPAEADVGLRWEAAPAVQISAERTPVPIDDQDPFRGSRKAPVTAVAFVDLLDPASRALTWSLVQLEDRYLDRVRFVYKHLPMDASCNPHRKRTAHARSCAVAVALQCAHTQRGYAAFRQAVLRTPDAVSDAELDATAARIGLDVDAFAACRAGEGTAGEAAVDSVEADIKQARQGPLGDPPWLFVEGRVVEGAGSLALVEATLAAVTGEREPDGERMVVPVVPVPGEATPAPGAAAPVTVEVDGLAAFSIDAVEAARTADGAAVARFGATPHAASLDEARAACAAVGRRLCSRAEWVAACQGAAAVDDDGDGDVFDDRREGRLRPHGDAPRGWCASDSVRSAATAAGCRTPEGAWDLAGNLAEWVDEGVLLGGSAGAAEVSCHDVQTPPGPGWRSATTGFRCCGPVGLELVEAEVAPAPVLPAPVAPPAVVEAAAGRPALVVPWRIDCAPCQQAMLAFAGAEELAVVAVGLDPDPAATAEWLARGGVDVVSLPDPEARVAGGLGVPGLPWVALYDADGVRIAAWDQTPTAQAVAAALRDGPQAGSAPGG